MPYLPGLAFDLGETIEMLRAAVQQFAGATPTSSRRAGSGATPSAMRSAPARARSAAC